MIMDIALCSKIIQIFNSSRAGSFVMYIESIDFVYREVEISRGTSPLSLPFVHVLGFMIMVVAVCTFET